MNEIEALKEELKSLKEANARLEEELAVIKKTTIRTSKVVDGIKPLLGKIIHKIERNITQSNLNLRVLRDGEFAETPLTALNPQQRRQVEAVVAYHKENPDVSICQCLRASFIEARGGYKFAGLKSFVFRNQNMIF